MGDLRSGVPPREAMLQHAGCRVVTMDVRGFGESSAEWPDYSARAVGRDAISILQQLRRSSHNHGNSFAAGLRSGLPRSLRPRQRVVLLGPIVRDLPPRRSRNLSSARIRRPVAYLVLHHVLEQPFPTKPAPDHAEVKAAIAANLREPKRMQALEDAVIVEVRYRSDPRRDLRAEPHRDGLEGSRLPGPCRRISSLFRGSTPKP